MRLGFEVPKVYIVPVERFCREMGPALGINLAEFEFPAYFNWFVRMKRCTLVVDSEDAENNIRRVFGETLLGPGQFRDHSMPTPNEDEDFDPSFPKQARPNFYKEFYHFRTAEESTNHQELTIDTLIEFCHFKGSQQGHGISGYALEKLGVPPTAGFEDDERSEEVSRRHTYFLETDNKGDELDESMRNEDGHEGESDEDTGNERPSLRRTISNPDVRKISLENARSANPGIAIMNESTQCFGETGPSKRVPRRGSMDSTGSFMSRGGRSRGGMSWASGASFMLTSDDEEDPNRHSWMYSQAKWLGRCISLCWLELFLFL
jgi:hypothetical protein